MPHVVVISPPFYSHSRPMAVLAGALKRAGARATFACVPEFAHLAARFDLEFRALQTTSNRNTGVALSTVQSAEDRARLLRFLDATRQGPVPALLTQARNRCEDMLAHTEEIFRNVAALTQDLRADWYLVDQLNYPVTLAMYCLRQAFATYCPGHPSYIPVRNDQFFGVPDRWPACIHPDPAGVAELRSVAADVDRRFTDTFNRVIASIDATLPPIRRAFAYSSPHARLFNYPPPDGTPATTPPSLYLGHCTAAEPLPVQWLDRLVGSPRLLVALGTFLSARSDVMRTVAAGVRRAFPDSALILAAGDQTAQLADLADDRTVVAPFVPQQALLSHVDAMVHHGGNNSFTECVAAGVPALILPFSSDQFAIGHDTEEWGVARCLDPNRAGADEVAAAIRVLLDGSGRAVRELADQVRQRGPDWAAPRLLRLMSGAGGGDAAFD
ncbi:MAG: glycosyltransferase family 1 protein [Pseudonocardiales bacterium]|nr:glycosyltransferase family 1 protein [Pseudonocardiales bacterium]